MSATKTETGPGASETTRSTIARARARFMRTIVRDELRCRPMTAVVIRGTPYPVVLPKLRDPRLHLAATIISLQVIGQVGFHFRRLDRPDPDLARSPARCSRSAIAVPQAARADVAGERDAHRQRRRVRAARPGHAARRLVEHAAAGGSSPAPPAVSLLSKYVITWRGEPHLQPVEHRARPLLPGPRARAAPSRSTSGGGRCRRGSCSRSR